MTTLETIAEKIIVEQARIIGPVAWSEAKKVSGLSIDGTHVTINAQDASETVNILVKQYERLFGVASREVCREAVAHVLSDVPQEEVPTSLRTV